MNSTPRFMFRGVFLVLVLVILGQALTASAQSRRSVSPVSDPNSGLLIGTVFCGPDSLIADALVRVVGQNAAELTGPNGRFDIRDLPMGSYCIEVEARGFKMERRNHVEVLPGQTVELMIELFRRDDSWEGEDRDWQRIYELEGDGQRFLGRVPIPQNKHALLVSYLTDGETDAPVADESFHQLKLRALGHPRSELSYLVSFDLVTDKFAPGIGSQIDRLRTGNWAMGSSRRESQEIRSSLTYSFAHNLAGWLDFGWEDATTDRYSHLWSRPGFVQTFLDTTQTGDIAIRRGRYSASQVDSTYQPWLPHEHLPKEELQHLELSAGFDHRVDDRSRYSLRVEFAQTEFDERVGDKKAWQYEGERQFDFWFNYTDREAEPFFVIAGDYPRLAWGESSQISVEPTFRHGYGEELLEVGGRITVRKQEYHEILRPYLTNSEGRIGLPLTDVDETHPHYTFFATKRAGAGDWGVEAGLRFDRFHINEFLPIEIEMQELQSEWTPSFGLFFEPHPEAGRVSLSFRRGYRLPTPTYTWQRDQSRIGTRSPIDAKTEAETFRSYEIRYLFDHGNGSVSLTGLHEDVSGQLYSDRSPSSTTTNRAFEIEVLSPFKSWISGSMRYRLADSVTGSGQVLDPNVPISDLSERSTDWDVRHRLRLAAQVGEPGNWAAEAIWHHESGRPFTKRRVGERPSAVETGRLPSTKTFDLQMSKVLRSSTPQIRLFGEAHNLFDSKNVADVAPPVWLYPPGYDDTIYEKYFTETGGLGGAHWADDQDGDQIRDFTPVNDPRVFGSPRSLRLGLAVDF